MGIETQQSIGDWADQAFGLAYDNARVAARANEEMAELLRAATTEHDADKLIEEAADVIIVLYRLAHINGVDLNDAIDKKMARNRLRVWKQDGTGHGYHIRDKS